MKKNILALFIALTMLMNFITPVKAECTIINTNSNSYNAERALPVYTKYYTKSKTINGVTVKIRIKCTEYYITGNISNIVYNSGDCYIVDVEGGSAYLTGDYRSGSAGLGNNNDLVIVVDYSYTSNTGYNGSNSITFTIRGNELV